VYMLSLKYILTSFFKAMILSACPRLVVIGDIHGDLQRFIHILANSKIINDNFEWIAEPKNTIVVQLGDQVDGATRNEAGDWETMPDTDVLRFSDHLNLIASMHGGKVISIIGNHELMNCMGDFMYVSPKSLAASGGPEMRLLRFQPGGPLAKLLANRSVIVKIGDCVFCHAGLLPHHLSIVNDDIEKINSLFKKFLLGFPLNPNEHKAFQELFLGPMSILWNRQYTTCSAENKGLLENVLARTNSRTMYVGHSVVPQIMAMYDRKLFFVDTGLSRAFNAPTPMILEVFDSGKASPTYKAMVLNV